MEKGNLRCDANVSVRRLGDAPLGTRVEIKNLNSIRFVAKALEHEIERQAEVIARGRADRPRDAALGRGGRPHRADAGQGRGARLPLFSRAGSRRARRGRGLDRRGGRGHAGAAAGAAGAVRREATASRRPTRRPSRRPASSPTTSRRSWPRERRPKAAANWIDRRDPPLDEGAQALSRGRAVLRRHAGAARGAPAPAREGRDLRRLGQGGPRRDDRLAGAAPTRSSPGGPRQDLRRRGARGVVAEIVSANPSQVALYRSGKTQTFGWFVGQVMKKTGGRADPAPVRAALERALGPEGPQA